MKRRNQRKKRDQRGISLIELLIAILIGSIAMFGLALPFVEGGNLLRSGTRRAEAQRDAQVVMHQIARVARQSNGYTINNNQITFTSTSCTRIFQRTGGSNNQLQMTDTCLSGGQPFLLIDGNRSQVVAWTLTQITLNKLVRISLQLSHRLRTTGNGQLGETLVTEFFLRNG